MIRIASLPILLMVMMSHHRLDALAHSKKKTGTVVMTVFVHGTILPLPSFTTLQDVLNSKSRFQDSFMDRYCQSMRAHSFVCYQPIQDFGLHPIEEQTSLFTTPWTLAQSYEEKYHEVYGYGSSIKSYTFGWRAYLSSAHRSQASDFLYWALIKEVKRLKRSHKRVVVHLLGHSHGGNVCLNLAYNERFYKKKLSIERLALFGTPIQHETEHLVNDSLFKRVYNITSQGDFVQRMDYFSTEGGYCKAHFDLEKADSRKVSQLSVTVNDWHPNHAELWFWGHPSVIKYRGKFPLFPMPVSLLTPQIMALADEQVERCAQAELKIRVKNNPQMKELGLHKAEMVLKEPSLTGLRRSAMRSGCIKSV